MPAALPNERMEAPDPALPVFESKGEPNRADAPEGMVLPWLMTMPSPREDIKIGAGARGGEKKLETAQAYNVLEGSIPATQLMPRAEGVSSVSPEFPTPSENGTLRSGPSKPGVIASWLLTTPSLVDAIYQERNRPETDAALKRLLHIAEQESRNFHAAERSGEGPDACTPELPPLKTAFELMEEVANGATPPHPAETYLTPEANLGTEGNSYAAVGRETEKSVGALDGRNERGWRPPANFPIVEDEIASTETQLERDWIRAVSVVPSVDPTPRSTERPKQSDVAVLTQRSRKGSITLLIASFFTASVVYIWARPFSNLPGQTEIRPSLASASTKEAPMGMEAQHVQKSLDPSATSSEPKSPVLSSEPESSGRVEIIVAQQPSQDVLSTSTPTPLTPAAKPKTDGDPPNHVPLASSEKMARPAQTPQQVGAVPGWQSYEVPEFGTRVEIPAGIFMPAGKPRQGSGQRFERADGRAVLSVYSRPNPMGESPASYLKQNLRVDRSALDYQRIARSFFAISLEQDGVILYSRCNFSSRARAAIHCFDLTYPQEEKRSWDAVVTRISLSLRPLEG